MVIKFINFVLRVYFFMFFNKFTTYAVALIFLVCSANTWAVQPTNLPADLEKTMVCGPKSRDPQTQWFISANQKVINEHVASCKQEGEMESTEHQSSLLPMANYLLTYVKKHETTQYLSTFQTEIERHIKEEKISLDWLSGAHFRYAALISTPSEEEKNFWGHPFTSEAGTFEAYFQTDKKGLPVALEPEKLQAALRAFDEKNEHSSRILTTFSKSLDKEIKKYILKDAHYPLLGESLLDARFLLNGWIDGIYPIAFPTEIIRRVHGVPETSPFSFAFHDFLHAKQDQIALRGAFRAYVERSIEAAKAPSLFVNDLIRQGVPVWIKKFNLLKSAVKEALGSVEGKQKSLMGLFLLIHEFPSFSPELFKQTSVSELFKTMRGDALEGLKNSSNWDNSSDPLKTNPVSGESSFTEDEIKQQTLETIKQNGFHYPSYIYVKTDVEGKEIFLDDKEKEKAEKAYLQRSRSTINDTKDFIHVTLAFEDGPVKQQIYPTLFRKTSNYHAYKGLFESAGLEPLQEPSFDGSLAKNRTKAIAFIDQRKEYLELLLNTAVEEITTHFQEGGEDSYENKYKEEYQKIETEVLEVVEGLRNPQAKN
jgi:hypothetical protein